LVIHLYILKCSDGSYYTGVTNNIERRLNEHENGDDPKSYTFNKRPVKLVFTEEFSDPHVAFAKEKQIKGWSRKKKEALIRGDWEELKRLSKSKK
jgi:putative endonuclease